MATLWQQRLPFLESLASEAEQFFFWLPSDSILLHGARWSKSAVLLPAFGIREASELVADEFYVVADKIFRKNK